MLNELSHCCNYTELPLVLSLSKLSRYFLIRCLFFYCGYPSSVNDMSKHVMVNDDVFIASLRKHLRLVSPSALLIGVLIGLCRETHTIRTILLSSSCLFCHIMFLLAIASGQHYFTAALGSLSQHTHTFSLRLHHSYDLIALVL